MRTIVTTLLLACLSVPACAADNLKEMFNQGTIKGQLRLMNYTRDFEHGQNQDFALGGLLYYKTAPLKGISFGTAFAATNDLANDDDDNIYYGITAPGHANVARLQEYYLQGEWRDTTIKVGAQELNTPFLHTHDVRMIPRTFRGLSVVDKSVRNLTLKGYYLKDNMDWVDDEFVSFTGDVYIAAVLYNLPLESMKAAVQAWYFSMDDGYNQTYFKLPLSKKLDNVVLHAAPTFFSQDSQGDELEGELDTYQYGLNLGISAYGFDLTGFYAKTGDDGIIDRWGYGKVIVQQVLNSARADEDAYALRLAYDFSAAGVKGLKAYAFYTDYDTPESGANASPDMDETDLNIQYAFSGSLEGLFVRARHAIINVDEGDDYTDTRFIVMYRF